MPIPHPRKLAVTVAAVLAGLVGTAACQGAVSDPAPQPPRAAPNGAPNLPPARAVPARTVQHVLAVSIDGLSSAAIRRLGPRGTPTLHRLMSEGAFTLNARTEYERTLTLPNHTGMLTGRRVDSRRGGHGVTFNTDRARTTVHRSAGEYVASVFDVVHDHGRSTALFSAKTKFALFKRTWNYHGAADRRGADHGRRKIDRVVLDRNNARLVDTLTTELRNSPRAFTFLHLSLPDLAGHRYGFTSARYLAAVRRSDRLVGRVLHTVTADSGLRDGMVVIVTADHGGRGKGHADPTRLSNYRVPFIVRGPGVPAARNLYSLNPDYRSPGSRRPTYRGRQPVRNGALANLSTDLLGLPAVPGSQFNRRHDLTVLR